MSNTFNFTKRAVVSAAAIAVLIAPSAASARVLGDHSSPAGPAAEIAAPVAAPISSSPSGFQWDDAAIGAAGALGLVAIAGASSGRVRRRHVTTS